MVVGTADPETRAVIELVEVLAPEALREAERWQDRADWDAGELTLTLTSWTARVEVVNRALAAIDDHWRLASAIVSAALSGERPGLTIRELIDRTPGLVVIEVSHGSLRVLLRDELRKAPIATLAAYVVLLGAGWTGIGAAIEFWSDQVHGKERCDIGISAPLSDDTLDRVRDVLAQLPPGCSVKIDLRAITSSQEEVGVAAKIERPPQPTPQPPPQPAHETEHIDAGLAVEAGTLSGLVGSAPPVAKGVTYERILNARSEPQNWLTYYGAYDGQRYSPLDQINKENVRRLAPAWVFQYGPARFQPGKSTYSFEAAPIVVNGLMFVSGWDGWVWALDAATGAELWRYKHASPFDVSLCCGDVNRGVAVAEGKVFMATLNAHVIALDAETGKKVWDQTYGDVRAGESATVAPLIVKDMVIVGSSGGEFGVRGHLDAFKLETGERVWRTYMVPEPGEPGSETWPDDGEAWARGGGNCWVTSTFDPELNLLYVGTGNPCPNFDGGVRPGDNLYTDSGVAVDADTGEIKAHFQYTPHDVWDYDSTMEHILFDLDGQKLAAHFDKNGFLYILDRKNMEPVRVAPFVDRIDWGEVDEKGNVTPKVFPDKEGDPVHFWPGPAGAKEWTHACYSPKTELLYAPVQDVGATATRRRREFKESIPYWGAAVAVDLEDMAGSVSAFDPRTGEERWRWRNDIPMCASVLATGGDLVFAGEPTGEFNALDASSGELLWQFQCGLGHHSSPTTYSVDGRQYIAVPTGWGAWTEGFLPAMLTASQGSALFAFALPEE